MRLNGNACLRIKNVLKGNINYGKWRAILVVFKGKYVLQMSWLILFGLLHDVRHYVLKAINMLVEETKAWGQDES